MQYDSYRAKVNKVAGILGKMYAHRLIIAIALVALTLILTALVMTKGLLVAESDCPAEVTYGDKLGYRVHFMTAKTHYEYREQGSNSWSEEKPIFPGRYQVRAYGKNALGERTYTEVHDFTITPRPLTLRVADTSVEYGDTLSIKAYGLAKGDKASCQVIITDRSVTPTTAYADTSTLRITDKKGNDRLRGYVIQEVEHATVHIKPRSLTVTVRNASKVYDDTALSFDGYEISKGTLLEGDNLVAIFRDTLVDAGTKTNTPTLHVYNRNGTDVTGLYHITVKPGKLTVEKRSLTVRAGSATYTYAGYEQVCTDFSVDPSTSLVSGHYLTVENMTRLLDCGTVDNVLTFRVNNQRGGDESHNYSIFVEAGTLTVTPLEVTVVTDSATLTYDGTDQSYPYVTVMGGVGDEYRAVDASTIRFVGSTQNRMTVEFYRGSQNITSNYIIKGYRYGTLTVEPREITVKMKDETRYYDGTPLQSGSFTVGGAGLPKGHTLTLDSRGEVIFGNAANTYVEGSLRIHDASGRDVTDNFRYTVTDGQLTVNPRPITIASESASKIYDGTPLSKDGWTIRSGSLVKGHELVTELTGASITEVGKTPNSFRREVTRIIDTATGKDVTEYYAITYAEGTLTVTARPITVKTESAEWMYDAQSHQGDPTVTLTAGTLLAGHTLERASDGASIHNAGSVPNKVTVRIMNGSEDVTRNYSITYNYGTLTVRKRPITVRVGSFTVTYDGYPHTNTTLSLASDSPYPLASPRHELRVKDSDRRVFTDAGSYINDPRISVYDPTTGVFVTANYEITRYDGTVTIEKRPLSIAIYGEKTYDGKPLSDWYLRYLDGTSPAAGQTVIAKPQYVPTDAESVTSVILPDSVDITAGGKSVLRNYTVTRRAGTLTVHKRPISVRTADAEKIYDGLPLTAYDLTTTPESLPPVAGHEIHMVVSGRATEVGQYPNTCYPQTFGVSKDGIDVTHNYELISVTEGTLTVKYDISLTVTTGSATKAFDGLPLTCDDYTVEITKGELPLGYAVYVDVTGLITRPGSVENTATVTVRDRRGEDVTPLFAVDLRPGVLTVTDELQEDTLFGSVYSDADGIIYLRMTSYGNYNGQGWLPATPYTGTLTGGYSPNLLPSVALKTLGLVSKRTLRFSGMRIAMLPYYTEPGGSNPTVGSDTDYTDALGRSYDITYYPVGDPLTLLSAYHKAPAYLKPLLLGAHADRERDYREFVHEQYLTLDSETRAFMETIIAEQGFDPADSNVVGQVAAYIRKAARYDLNYDPALDQADNVAIAFLRDYREGVCVHYATAATLLYRALGIPARYTTGFMLEVKGGEWNRIESPGHAWVEVYVDGLGWIQIEVTGSANDPDLPDPPDTPDDPPVTQKPVLELIPAFTHKVYDGTYLYAAQELTLTPSLEALLQLGYTYTVRVSGAIKEIGDGASAIGEFTLYDPTGKDVTDTFRVVKRSGLLRVTRPAVEVLLYPLTKSYDGRPALWSEGDYTVLTLPDGVTLTLTVTVPADKLGFVTLSELNQGLGRYAAYRLEKNGTDVTADYDLVFTLPDGMEDTPVLTVTPRPIELTAASETRIYDGEALTNSGVYITKGSLAAGHSLTAMTSGTQTEIGSSANTVSSYQILDSEGRDVTSLYRVTTVNGQLTVLAQPDT